MSDKSRLVIVVGLLVCLLWATPALADKQYGAESFDVVLDVQPDGSLEVTETVHFRFEGGPFTYAFRDLAYTEIDQIDRLQASMDGAVLPQGTDPGRVEILAGRPLKVTWHFAPTSDSTREFVLTYRVQGAIRREVGADALIWRAVPEDHDYDVGRSTITLRYPPAISLLDIKLAGAAAKQESGDGWVQWTANGIGTDESLVVSARFPPASLADAPPAWQAARDARRQQTARAVPLGWAAGLLTLCLGLAVLAAFLARRRRTGPAPRLPAVRPTAPPDQAPPGLAVRLARNGTPALATLFDLAGRGLLAVDEAGKGLLGGRRYRLERLPRDADLRPHEKGLLRALFEDKGGAWRDSLPLSDVAGRLAGRAKWLNEPLDEEMASAGWLDPQRQADRTRLIVRAVVAIVAGGVVMAAGLILGGMAATREAGPVLAGGAIAAGVGGALLVLGLIALIAAAAFSPLTEQGEGAAVAWKSFAAYLKDIVRGREFVAGEDLFQRYLPFAAGFGLGERWARHFQEQGYSAVPGWFRALEADGADFGAVVAVLAATDASFSTSDGSAAGAAGASGGGSSGAG